MEPPSPCAAHHGPLPPQPSGYARGALSFRDTGCGRPLYLGSGWLGVPPERPAGDLPL